MVRAPNVVDNYRTIIGEEIVGCSLRLAAYRYSNTSATGTNFTVGSLVPIPLENGTIRNDKWLTFHQDPLPALVINQYDLQAIINFFTSDVFTGNITVSSHEGANSGVRSPFLTGDIAAKFDAMAQSMTDYIRSGPSSQLAFGSRITSVVFVRVDWRWLALPLFEALAAVVLLLWTMIRSHRATGLALWKDSSLALLFSEYRPGDGLLRPNPAGPDRVEEAAKAVYARLM